MTAREILEEIKPLGSDSYKRVIFNHGVKEPCFGVKISDLQRIVKRIKRDYQLALDLYDTGIYDAMYLAGLIADDARMTKKDLQHWPAKAYCRGLSGATVAWVAAGSAHGWELGLEWIERTLATTRVRCHSRRTTSARYRTAAPSGRNARRRSAERQSSPSMASCRRQAVRTRTRVAVSLIRAGSFPTRRSNRSTWSGPS